MTFKKLALASAIALVPVTGFSLEALDDSTLSDVTGQDGIEIIIDTPVAGIGADIFIHDKDGLGAATTSSFDGAIVIDNFSLAGDMTILIDAGDTSQAGLAPVLQIAVNFGATTIVTGDIRVANSQRDDVASGWGLNTTSGVLLNTMTIALAGLSLNIQLGNEPQGNMIRVLSTITNGVTVGNFGLRDAGGALTGGVIGSSSMLFRDNGGTNLTLDVAADATTAGLVIDVNAIGSATGMDVRITDQYLGTTGAGIIGDIAIVGLNLANSVITISGK